MGRAGYTLRSRAVGLALLALLAAGCSRDRGSSLSAGGASAESAVEQALAAARDGDRIALGTHVLPGTTSEGPFLELLQQGALKGVSWQVARSRELEWNDIKPRAKSVLVQFSPAVTVGGTSFSNLSAVAMVDTADNRKAQNLLTPVPTSPRPTGRWVVIASMLASCQARRGREEAGTWTHQSVGRGGR